MTLSASAATAAGLAAGYVADRVLGDPRTGHPVAGFGRLAAALEKRVWADRRSAGMAYVGLLVGSCVAVGATADRLTRRRPVLRAGLTAAATWAVLGGRSLGDEAAWIAYALSAGDLPAARARLPHLVGRDPTGLDEAEMARAVVESVAENTSDAVVAPLVWGALAGLPGLLGYRAVNTLDAMVGQRSARYRRFGWAAARLDDAANWLPARFAGLLTVLLARAVGGSTGAALAVVRRDGGRHPSPNAGIVEAAFAGALGVRLGGRNVYGGRPEDRGPLGSGPAPDADTVPRAVRLSALVSAAAAVAAVAAVVVSGAHRRLGPFPISRWTTRPGIPDRGRVVHLEMDKGRRGAGPR